MSTLSLYIKLPGYSSAAIKENVLNILVSIRSALKQINESNTMSKGESEDNIRRSLETLVISMINKFSQNTSVSKQASNKQTSNKASVRLYTSTSSSSIKEGDVEGVSEQRVALAVVRMKTISEVSCAAIHVLLL